MAPPLLRWLAVKSVPQIPVAIFLTSFDPGGTERQMTELIRRLDPARFRVYACCFRREGAWLPKVLDRGVTVVDFPIRGFARPQSVLQLLRFARWCRRERIAAVQTCDFYANVFGLLGAYLGGVPVRIGSRRELVTGKSASQINAQRWAYRFATKVVANSPAAFQILETEGIPASKIQVIANGVEAQAFSERKPRETVREIITVANLRPEKNHETLIAAAGELAQKYPDLRVRIVGDGERRGHLERFVHARGLSHIVEFLGHREDVPALLRQADAYVLPTRSEAFPNGAIEAMAAGLPVVASAVGGLLDLIVTGRTGILVDPGDAAALAAALESLMTNPAAAHALGAEARREVLSRYSFERMVAAFEQLYESELRMRTTPRITRPLTEPAVSDRQRVEGPALSERQRAEGGI